MGDFVFYSMASGSSGNSYYIGNGQYGFLIDAGISGRAIVKHLKAINVDLTQVRALFVTHIHKDHTKSMSVFGNRWNIPVYTTRKVHVMIDEANYIHKKVSKINRRYIEHEDRIQLGDFHITSFFVPHDAVDNSGFIIEYKGIKLVLATDIGHATPQLIQAVKEADYLIVESNHDRQMLENGSYPMELKKRVASDVGHMCNEDAAQLVATYRKDSLRHVFLCHLSMENNTPELAVATMRNALGDKVPVDALNRNVPQLFILS